MYMYLDMGMIQTKMNYKPIYVQNMKFKLATALLS